MSVSLSPQIPPRVAAEVFRSSLTRRQVPPLVADALTVVGASLVVAGLAQIAIPLPFTPIPLTGQTLGVLLAALLLGPQRAGGALGLYLLEGAAGLPIFSQGGAGATHLAGPTAGYSWAFPLAACLVGSLAARGWGRKPITCALAMALGSLLILTLGAAWLSLFVGGLGAAFAKGFAPFVVGEAIKMTPAAVCLPLGWRLLGRASR